MTTPPAPDPERRTLRGDGRGLPADGSAADVRRHVIEVAPRTLLYVVLTGLGVWVLWQLWTVVIVLTVALILVGTLDPMVAWLGRRGLPRGWALALVFLTLAAALVVVLLLSVPPLVIELQHMIEEAPRERVKIIYTLEDYKWAAPFVKAIRSVPLDELMVRAGNEVLGYSADVLSALGYGVTTLFLAIYLLADPRHAKGLLFAVVARHHHVKLARIMLELKLIVGGYMRGQVITSVAITIFMFALMSALRVDNALSIAIFAGFTDIIPFVGGYVASAPAVAAVSSRGALVMLAVAAAAMLYQEFESRILVPRVYGRVLRLSPALVLTALLIGGTLLGVLGALLALPIAAGVQMLVRELRVDLPGQPDLDDERARDERAEVLYERLTAGTPAADAQIIAGELAQKIKQTESAGGSLTAEMPAIIAEIDDTAPPSGGAAGRGQAAPVEEDAREVAEQAQREAAAERDALAKAEADEPMPSPREPKKP